MQIAFLLNFVLNFLYQIKQLLILLFLKALKKDPEFLNNRDIYNTYHLLNT